MSECHDDNSCDTNSNCDTGSKQSDECTFAEDLLCLAKSAKHDLLKEKMKKIFEAKMGKKLDKIAEVGVEAVIACMNQKIAAKQACDNYKTSLMEAMKG